MPPTTPDNTLPADGPGLTQEEIKSFGVSLAAILKAMREGIKALRKDDRDLTCEEVATVIAAGLPAVGRLCDELIADAKD